MADFDVKIDGKYLDIKLKSKTNKKIGAVINAIYEEGRLTENQPRIPLHLRNGSIKDFVSNLTGLRYGSLVKHYLRNQDNKTVAYITSEIEKKLTELVNLKEISKPRVFDMQKIDRGLLFSISYSHTEGTDTVSLEIE